jgi:hypothetical protein
MIGPWISNINDWIKEANKWCYDLWDSSLDVMEYYNFPHAGPIKEALPSQICRNSLEEQ